MSISDQESELKNEMEVLKQRIVALEQQLDASEANFRLLTDHAPVGIYIDDAQGRATYVNPKCAELVGVPPEKALNFDWLPYLHPDDRDRMLSEWKKAFESSSEFHLDYRWVHSDGKVVWTLGEVIPILNDEGKAIQFIGTLTDITAQKDAEIEKDALRSQLVQAQKMESIGRLAGGVAHDYNNMLGAIIGYSEMALREVEEDSSLARKLIQIHKAANRSADITRQLLSFARQQASQPVAVDVTNAINDLVKMLRHLIGEDIELIWQVEDVPLTVKIDLTQFDQILVNLCINARDAISGSGEIRITARKQFFTEQELKQHHEFMNEVFVEGDYVCISVADTGCGMSPDMLSIIFEPFFTTKDISHGTGLGLASVYGIIKQHSGYITVSSELGVGSEFHIYLPIHNGDSDSLNSDRPDTMVQGQGQKVLIVEDEPALLQLMDGFLSQQGYEVLIASSGPRALAIAEQHHDIQLIITDVIMPSMNGAELVAELRKRYSNQIYLYMSGYTNDVIAKHGLIQERVNFLQKPFTTSDLAKKVFELLNS